MPWVGDEFAEPLAVFARIAVDVADFQEVLTGSVWLMSKTYAAGTQRVVDESSVSVCPRRVSSLDDWTRIKMPFSPFFTKRPSLCHVWKPAT